MPADRRDPGGAYGVVVVGDGWFPDAAGGLNRYVRGLHGALSQLVRTRTLVLAPASEVSDGVAVVGDRDDPLPVRVLRFARAARATARPTDLLDVHFALYGWLPALTRRDDRVIAHFHGPWFAESALGGDSRVNTVVKRLLELIVYRRASRVVTLSSAFRRLLVERYGVSPWKVRVIAPGVDSERFSVSSRPAARAALGISGDAWVAMSARRLVPRMGLDVLLESWRSVVAATDRELVLLIAGDGPDRARLEARADALGVEPHVRFLGNVDERTLVECYRAADVSVVPSVALEGFGLVVLEALACGTPVVATDSGGIPEALAGLDESLIVPAGDAHALAERLIRAIDGSAPLETRERCRQHALRYSWEAAAREHVQLADEMRARGEREKLRGVYLSHCARLSGAEIALLRLLPALADVSPHVIVAEDGPLLSRFARAGVSAEVLPLDAAARELPREHVTLRTLPLRSALRSALYTVRLAYRIRRLKPDFVHANSLKACVYGVAAARLAGVPVVWHARDRVSADYVPASAVRWLRWMIERLPDAVIANSQATLDTLGGGGRRRGQVRAIVYDPLPVQAPVPRREAGPLVVGMVGRIAPWKGQHVFLDAFARAFPDGDERAVVVGAPLFGEDSYERELHALADTLGLSGRVEFRGFREDVAAELAGLHVLVHASVIPEPFGQVVTEGMAAGLPVVAAAAGGPAETLDGGRTGLLYPPGDAQALADALVLLAADPELRRRLGDAARAEVGRFAPARVGADVSRVYREMLGRSRTGRAAGADPGARGRVRRARTRW